MSDLKKINLAELASTYEPIPDGEYQVKVTDVIPKVSSAGNDMLEVTFTIVKGPHKGSEVRQWFSLKVGEKNGKIQCVGLSQMASIYKKIGIPEKQYSVLDPDKVEAGRLFSKCVRNKTLEAFISTEERKDSPGKTSSRVKILGLAGMSEETSTTNDEDEE